MFRIIKMGSSKKHRHRRTSESSTRDRKKSKKRRRSRSRSPSRKETSQTISPSSTPDLDVQVVETPSCEPSSSSVRIKEEPPSEPSDMVVDDVQIPSSSTTTIIPIVSEERVSTEETQTTSQEKENTKEDTQKKEGEEGIFVDPFVQFNCTICKLNEKCLFGELKAVDGFYGHPMFYMRDPFIPQPKIKGRKPELFDFLVLGSTCKICEGAVCLDKGCSVYFGGHFCAMCIARERRRFPEKVVEIIFKAQTAREQEEEAKKKDNEVKGK